ncbi:hypothetical protein [Streptomyces sp. NPDC046939]|uniref:hypothetical protein n=1 Tax=Streptomyces sp. NPDC046939 TaxID=3155376 RepID=UPI0033CA88FE
MPLIAHWSGENLHEDVAMVVGDAGGVGLYCRVCQKRWRLDALLERYAEDGQEAGGVRGASRLQDVESAWAEVEGGFRAVSDLY